MEDLTALDILFDTIGLIGVTLILIGYFLIQTNKITSMDILYPLLNLMGATLLLISLFHNWNTPSVIIELFWIAISLYGIYTILRNRRKGTPPDAKE